MSKTSDEKKSDRIDGLKICYIGGGSVGWAHNLMNDLALCPLLNGEVRLYDVVPERARMNARYGQKVFGLPQAKSRWHWRAVPRLTQALKGADFVFLSITPGHLESMAQEIEICERFGLFHPVGNTVGPAGLMRGLRAARMYAGFAHAIAQHAPQAWVINYTNPMTICTRALSAAESGIHAFGCCHEVFGAQELLSKLVERYLKVPRPPRAEIDCTVTGINHFTWITEAHWKGTDLAPLWRRYFQEEPSVRPRYTAEQLLTQSVFVSFHCVAAALSQRYGVLAAAGDRHLSEFVSGFLLTRQTPDRWGIRLTPVREYRIPTFNDRVALVKRRLAGREKIEVGHSGEEAIRQLLAILGVGDLKTNVNLPNVGQIPDLPKGAVVETNAYFGANRVTPLFAGPTPRALLPLLNTHVANQENIVAAALTTDANLALAALANDPLNHLPFEQTAKLFDELVAATKPWSYPTTPPK